MARVRLLVQGVHTGLRADRACMQVIAAIKQSVSVRFRTGGAMFMIVGMPNVGKSSILNALRRKAMPKDSGKRGASVCRARAA